VTRTPCPTRPIDLVRRCPHVMSIRPVLPRSTRCDECVAAVQEWVELWLCLTCGWVACSDDSAGQHARAHYAETDHPIVARLCGASDTLWCHVDQRSV
jgi:uncharacterized UBP type Zn finger protein